MLSGKRIIEEVKKGRIEISPFEPKKMGPNSYDLTLDRTLQVYKRFLGMPLNPKVKTDTEKWMIPDDGLSLRPGILYLGNTVEVAGSKYYIPCIEGRSSLARLGVQIHMTAGFGDIGFVGQWTLEIQVVHSVILYPNMRVCQIYFSPIVGDYNLYDGKYKNSKGVISSRAYEDKEFKS